MSTFIIFGKSYTEAGLKALLPAHMEAMTDSDERDALEFIHRWLNGDEFFLQQTSGSTGTPSQIHITLAQMEQSARLTGWYAP